MTGTVFNWVSHDAPWRVSFGRMMIDDVSLGTTGHAMRSGKVTLCAKQPRNFTESPVVLFAPKKPDDAPVFRESDKCEDHIRQFVAKNRVVFQDGGYFNVLAGHVLMIDLWAGMQPNSPLLSARLKNMLLFLLNSWHAKDCRSSFQLPRGER